MNLFHALDRMRPHFGDLEGSLKEAKALWREVEETERAISRHGAKVLRGQVLTHCNTGPLATGGFGTALGAILEAHRQGRVTHVWVDETRPYLQGARLTAFELMKRGSPPPSSPTAPRGSSCSGARWTRSWWGWTAWP